MDLSVIIVSWNVREKLQANLSALSASTGNFKFEILVVDNNSADGSADLVRSGFPSIKLIANQDNRGFAAANNQAIRIANGRYILLLNPDMQVQPDTLANILAWAQKNPQATVTGCKLVDEQGETVRQVRLFPALFDQLMITLKVPHFYPAVVDRYLCANFDYSQAAPVDSIRGAFFLINLESYRRVSGLDRPFLDERYFIWFEEVDFCRQIRQSGGEIWYSPAAVCLDYVGQSFKQLRRGQSQKYFRDSMLEYFKKWESPWQYFILRAVWRLLSVFFR